VNRLCARRALRDPQDAGFSLLETVLAIGILATAAAAGASVALVSSQASAIAHERLQASEILNTVLASQATSAQVRVDGVTYNVTVQIASASPGVNRAVGTVTWQGPGGTTDRLTLSVNRPVSTTAPPPLVVGGG